MLEEMEYIKDLSTEELISIVTEIFDFEETGFAFAELRKRDDAKATEMGLDILLNDKGDEFLQAIVYDLLTDKHLEEVLNVIDQRGENLANYLVKEVINELPTSELYPEFFKNNEALLRRLKRLYEAMPKNEQDFTPCDYPAFLSMVAEHGIT